MEKNISADGDARIEGLMHLGIPALQQKHRDLFGKDCTVLHVLYCDGNSPGNFRRAQGSLSEESRQHALGIAWQTTLRTRAHSLSSQPLNKTTSLGHDTRLPPPGTFLKRSFKGKTVLVKVLAAGFEYDGRIFGSLSPIANEVTGGNWNGFVFFRLSQDARHGR